MNREEVEKELTAILPVAAQVIREHAEAKAAGRFPNSNVNFWNLCKGVGVTLSRQPEFSVSRGYIDFGGAGTPFHPSMFATSFVQFAVERGIDGAFAWVEKIITMKAAQARCIFLVRGVKVEDPVCFAGGKIILMAFDTLPESDHKRAERSKGYVWVDGAFPRDLPASAALMMPLRIDPLFIENIQTSPLQLAIRELERIAHALSVVTGHAIIPEQGWAEYLDPDITAAMTGRSWHGGMEEIRPAFLQDHAIDETEAVPFIDAYLALPQDVRNLADVAIKRLNQAMRRQDPTDRALDAAIGLEVLLGDKKDQGEITERLSRRGAILLGGDLAKRRETQQSIRHLYRFRSAVVHTGSAGGIPKHSTPEEVTGKGIQVGLAAVRKIVSLQTLPPWEEWELLGRP
jgi:Apea-like HEPN